MALNHRVLARNVRYCLNIKSNYSNISVNIYSPGEKEGRYPIYVNDPKKPSRKTLNRN